MVFGSAEMLAHQASVSSIDFMKSQKSRSSSSSQRMRKMRSTFSSSTELRSLFDDTAQVNSNLKGSASYSFGPGYGKPRHLKGKFHIEVLDRRHKDHVASDARGPGVGAYDLQSAVGRHEASRYDLPAHRELVEKHGHPEYSRSPGYMFGAATEIRDQMVKRYTHLSKESFYDAPGPGRYTGPDHTNKLLRKQPSYSLGPRNFAQFGKHRTPAPGDYDVSREKELLQPKKPAWKFDVSQRAFEAIEESYGPERVQHRYTEHMGTPDELGPGTYRHMTSLHSQFF
mmetsp:Transcript_66203/g.158342  ORF Transcript_66203/g.158342 Transcript_66203/m.158342 type:complete len:284 (-) Transcript_66203:216-1067(-)